MSGPGRSSGLKQVRRGWPRASHRRRRARHTPEAVGGRDVRVGAVEDSDPRPGRAPQELVEQWPVVPSIGEDDKVGLGRGRGFKVEAMVERGVLEDAVRCEAATIEAADVRCVT